VFPFIPQDFAGFFYFPTSPGTRNIQMNLAITRTGPGTYSHEPFNLFSPSFGVVGSVGAAVTVSETPEPAVAGLLGLGSLILAATRRIAQQGRSCLMPPSSEARVLSARAFFFFPVP